MKKRAKKEDMNGNELFQPRHTNVVFIAVK